MNKINIKLKRDVGLYKQQYDYLYLLLAICILYIE